jgi:hypothetical protein
MLCPNLVLTFSAVCKIKLPYYPAAPNSQKRAQSIRSPKRQKFAQSGHPVPQSSRVDSRVAGCFIFKPKIPVWVNFGGR